MPVPTVKKGKRSKGQTYQQKQNAVCITLYDTTGETLSPLAREEFEEDALRVAQQHPNVLLSIATT
jgi:hypothetical protein